MLLAPVAKPSDLGINDDYSSRPTALATMATSPSSSRPPASLKGITSTNVDPALCAVCSSPFPVGLMGITRSSFAPCCGKRSCMDCFRAGKDYVGRTGRGPSARRCCSFCKSALVLNDKNMIGLLKKHAKKGAAVGAVYSRHLVLHVVRMVFLGRTHDAKRWYEKAAKQGHPVAMIRLGNFFPEMVLAVALSIFPRQGTLPRRPCL